MMHWLQGEEVYSLRKERRLILLWRKGEGLGWGGEWNEMALAAPHNTPPSQQDMYMKTNKKNY